MARELRKWSPNTSYHVTARGNRKSKIFKDKQDYNTYLYFMAEALDEFEKESPYELISYCLMNNHVHLLIHTSTKPLGPFIQKVHMRYAMYFNDKYDYTGHLFEGRFHSGAALTASERLSVSSYIHLNPVKANIVSKPGDYLYSSYRYSAGLSRCHITNDTKILSVFNSAHPCIYYKNYVESKIKV